MDDDGDDVNVSPQNECLNLFLYLSLHKEILSEPPESSDEDDEDDDDNASFASVDDLSGILPCLPETTQAYVVAIDEGEAHLQELSKLAEKDPEFYKYLQENEKELLEFDPQVLDKSLEMDEETDEIPILTKETLMRWQKALLEVI